MRRGSRVWPVIVIAAAVISVWPMVRNPSRVADFGSDGWLITWILNRSGENISEIAGNKRESGSGLFDANIYYPYMNVLAYSDMFMVSGYLTHFLVKAANNPGAAFGITMIAGQAATMLLVYLGWTRLEGATRAGAMLGAVVFGLSQIRWHYQVHLQMFSMQIFLAAVLLLTEWIKEEKKKHWKLYAGTGLLGMQIWESLLPVYFAFLVVGLRLFSERKQTGKLFAGCLGNLILAGLIFGLIATGPALAYRGVGQEFNYQRTIRDAAHNGMSLDELTGIWSSPGLYLLLLVAGIFLRRKKLNRDGIWLVLVIGGGLIMAMGPVVKWKGQTVKLADRIALPLPYAAAYYAVPGFTALRTPSRWIWVSAWAASGLIAIGLGRKKRAGIMAALFTAAVGGTMLVRYADLPRQEDVPAVYVWLKTQPGEVVLELPAGKEISEHERMYFSLFHNKQLVGGASGFAPPDRERLLADINREGPSRNIQTRLGEIGVDYVVVHRDEGGSGEWGKLVYSDETTLVFGR